MSNSINQIVDQLEKFYREELNVKGRLALHEPCFEGNEWEYVKECLDTGWVSTAGKFVDRIESMAAELCGTDYAVAVVNGTSALHLTLIANDIGAGDAVICPALTFVATANAISYSNASPLFVDICPKTRGIDPVKLRKLFENDCTFSAEDLFHKQSGLRIKAVMPVHIFGHPVEMDALMALAQEYNLIVIEDSAEALGSLYKNKPCGSLSNAGILSFNGNKIVTTGGGGMIVTNDEALAKSLKHLSTTARISTPCGFEHDEIGYNYRMPNINAALGCAQLEKLPDYIKRKRELANRYMKFFAHINGITMLSEPAKCTSNQWLNAILLEGEEERDEFLELTNARSIETRPCWRLLPELKIYESSPCALDLSVAKDIVARLVNLPSGPQLMTLK